MKEGGGKEEANIIENAKFCLIESVRPRPSAAVAAPLKFGEEEEEKTGSLRAAANSSERNLPLLSGAADRRRMDDENKGRAKPVKMAGLLMMGQASHLFSTMIEKVLASI
ncbi:hypothetical protein OUZ56_010808 [Daphnia magna]|uniref:Uncharacterized protein n=1 Tax=Daphnia magna TaxID=35525 RepID=A0ABQ9YZ20_9CRUS|nr:hypothetical protein OUZ56_010808 [Daphnia magna]